MRAKDDEKKRTMGLHDDRKRYSGVHVIKQFPENFQLHVHSDHSGTGGHWCAKIFFFSLFVILLGLICLIIMENRGLKELDKPLSESRYAEILEGWVDDDLDAHDNHNGKTQIHDKDIAYHDQHEYEGFADNSAEHQTEDEQENYSEEENSIENELDDKKDDHLVEIEDNDENLSEEIDSPHDSHSIERKILNSKEIKIEDPIKFDVVKKNDIDELVDHETEDESTLVDIADEPTENSQFAVRIIVGLALVIVAHQVLLKKPRTNDDNADQYESPETIEENVEIIEMKRRLTLVTAEEPIPLNEEDMKKHPLLIEDIPATEDKQFLITANSPISEEETFDDDPISDEIVLNEEKELCSEEEILSSEDISSDDELNDYESSETSDIDDSDLLKRLDEKYGKLPQHSDTDDIDNDPTWTKIDHSGPSATIADDSYVESDLIRDQLSQESHYH